MKKRHPEHVNLERWLVSYADFITLLFAFFVVMYAISQADMQKLKQVSEGLKSAFGKAGPVGVVELRGKGSGTKIDVFEDSAVPGGRILNMPAGKVNVAQDPDGELQGVKDLLEEAVSLELGVADASDTVQMMYDSRGLVVRVAAKGLFRDGAAEVAPELRGILRHIGRVVTKTDRLVRVEGHTAPGEFIPPEFKTAWGLSAARSSNVIEDWLAHFKIDPRRLGAAGYAANRPIKLGPSKWDQMSNRRVEIIFLNNRYESLAQIR